MVSEKYKELFDELNGILRDLEADKIGVDELTDTLSRAYKIVDALKSRLHDVESQVRGVITFRDQFKEQ